ncbi:MAG: hypothetical protein SGPRY_009281 [Prymnesium sp.]
MESLSQPRHRPQLLVRRSGLSPSPPPGQTDATTLDGLLLTHQHQSGSAAPDGPAESSPHGWRLASCMHLLSWSSPEVLRGSQAICTLLQLILAPNLAVRSEALYALWNISADEEGALAISSHGGMPLIVKAVSVGEAERHACVGGSSTGLELQRCAVAALRNLAVRSEAALPLYEAGIMPSLLRLLQKGNGVPLEMKHDALLVLWQMSSFQPLISPMLQAGLADGLIALLGETMRFRQPSGLVHSLRSRARQPASSNGESDTTNMVLAICCICCNLMIEEVAVARLLELNVIGSLIPLLEGSVEGGECEAAAACLENICITQPHFTRECVLTGGVDALLGVMRRCGEACPEEGHSTLSHTIRAMLAVAGTDAGLLTILRGQGLQLCVALISLPLRSRMQCMLLELTILILEGSHPQSRYPTSDKILSELSSQLHALLSPPSLYQTRSHEVTQRALHALRIALTQRPTDSAVAEMGRQLPILSFLSHELLVGWCDQSGERVNKVRAMACDAAACVGLLAMEESTAASLVKQGLGAIGALIALLPNARDEQKTPKIKCNSPLRVEPYKRTPPSWRHSEISAIEAGYQLRLQVSRVDLHVTPTHLITVQ